MNEPSPSPGSDATGQRLRDLFERAVELGAAEREAFIAANARDATEDAALRRLLAADDTRGFLDMPASQHAAHLAAEELTADGLIGQCIGDFRLVRALGRGGMAAVFLGERVGADFRQQAAVKLLRRGLYSELEQRLFQRERQVLAALEHPNIARIIDGGMTAAGVPYLVMEHVDGVPITQYAAERALDLRGRLRLFVAVCRAVEAAHRNLIVHRDIKPSNILVEADGTVKLLDFGIAKLLEEDEAGATVGVFTPDYAAPEQTAGGTITTATDVYGLGILLHELLLGVRPGATPTRRPSARVDDPAAVTARNGTATAAELRRQLRGDLDNILLKALEHEPHRRYTSAGALADDIERHLEHRPVAAHPPSRLYRAGKFVQRHRAGVLATTLFALGLLGALGLALWQAHLARVQAARANTVRDFLIEVFDAARAHLPRDQRPTPEALVDQARRRLATAAQLDDATRAELLRTLGDVSLSLSDFTRARGLYGEAKAMAAGGRDATVELSATVGLADALQRAGRNADAMAQLRPLLATLRTTLSPLTLRALGVQAEAEIAAGTPDAALTHRREAAALASRLYGEHSTEAIAAAFEVGNMLAEQQRYPEAIAELEPLLERWRAGNAPEDDRYVAALASLASAHDGVGDSAASEARFRELLTLQRRIYTAPHDAIAKTLRDLGWVLRQEDKFGEAESLLHEALEMQRKIYGENHVQVAETHDTLGAILVAQRRFPEADAEYRSAIAICDHIGVKDEICPRSHNNFGMALYREGRLDEAKVEMTKALEERRALFGNDHPVVAFSLSTLANVAVKQNNFTEAVRLSKEALEVLERVGRSASREGTLVRNTYAQALWLDGRGADALREVDRTLADWQHVEPEGKARHASILALKAQILAGLKRNDEAHRTAQEAIALGVDSSELSPTTRRVLSELGRRSVTLPESAQATQK